MPLKSALRFLLNSMNSATTPLHSMHATQQRILVIEDEQDIRQLLAMHLDDICDEVVHARDGAEGLRLALSEQWQLIVLDIGLPRVNGLDICKELRKVNDRVPVLILTARSEEIDRVLGLELGADDYLTKPFSVLEFMARARALIRRSQLSANTINEVKDRLTSRHIALDFSSHRVFINGNEIELTAKEFDLLAHFMGHPGKIFSRADLLSQVWNYNHAGYQHTVNSHINRLRAKIEPDPNNPSFISTVWGVGYRFTDEP